MKKHLQRFLSVLTIGLILLLIYTVAVATEPAASATKSNDNILSEYSYANIEKTVQGDTAQTTTLEKATTTVANADKNAVDNNTVLGKYKLLVACSLLAGMLVSLLCVLCFVKRTHHSADDIVHASALVLLISALCYPRGHRERRSTANGSHRHLGGDCRISFWFSQAWQRGGGNQWCYWMKRNGSCITIF